MVENPIKYGHHNRHGGHDGWSAESSNIAFKENPIWMIQATLGLNWPIGFRGEDF
jgi:hypothetical protein